MSKAPKPSSNSRLAFITGASSGIGQALAARYYHAGFRLALVARRSDQMQSWVNAQTYDPTRVAIYSADVRDHASIASAAHACMETDDVPDVVIASAGISIGMDTAIAGDLEVMRAIFETNNLGMAATFQPFVGPMRDRGHGTLVGVASMAGIRGLPGHAAYCSSKAAVISYCESLRGECRPHGVRVVTLVPGCVDTPLTRENRYGMPFLMSAERFAALAFSAIERGASYRVIPWQMGVAARLLRLLPNMVFDALMLGRPRKQRRGQ